MRGRRLRKHAAELDVTAFINLIVVLVPFLLSTAVFTRLSVIDLSLPAQSNNAVEQLKVDDLKLEIVIRADALEVGDKIGGLIQRIPMVAGKHDLAALNTLAQQIKTKFPTHSNATVLSMPDTPYDTLVQLMDTLREVPGSNNGNGKAVLLFPAISIGDAPISAAEAAAATKG
jgi:biopolymer transport protein ExbD